MDFGLAATPFDFARVLPVAERHRMSRVDRPPLPAEVNRYSTIRQPDGAGAAGTLNTPCDGKEWICSNQGEFWSEWIYGRLPIGRSARPTRSPVSGRRPVLIVRAEPSIVVRTILAATDLSDPSLPAIRAAAAVARMYGASLTVVHIMDGVSSASLPITVDATMAEIAGHGLAEALSRSDLAGDVRVTLGPPTATIGPPGGSTGRGAGGGRHAWPVGVAPPAPWQRGRDGGRVGTMFGAGGAPRRCRARPSGGLLTCGLAIRAGVRP